MTPITTEFDFRSECFMEIISYYNSLGVEIDPKDIYVVWQTKVLQNFKALLSTNYLDRRYFEITYNGDKNEMYFDAYVKENNICFN